MLSRPEANYAPLADGRRYALVWGKSSKFNPQPQKVGLTHLVQDEDV
jgi:ribosome-interacting GTPase 1